MSDDSFNEHDEIPDEHKMLIDNTPFEGVGLIRGTFKGVAVTYIIQEVSVTEGAYTVAPIGILFDIDDTFTESFHNDIVIDGGVKKRFGEVMPNKEDMS